MHRITRREFSIGLMGMAPFQGAARYDVVVIGAGAFGAWIALECRQRGWSVLLLDSHGPANAMASSGGESRILRVGYGPQISYSRWALRSITRWRQVLGEIPGPQPLFLHTGVLWLGPKNEPYLRATIEGLRELNVRHDVLDAETVNLKYPQLRVGPSDIGILEVDSGTVLARRAIHAVVARALERGIEYRTRVVTPPKVQGRLAEIVTGQGDTIRADQFVFACGPWLPSTFPDLLGDQIVPTR